MKNVFTILLLALAMTTMAQTAEVSKVAILETIDKDNSVDYGKRLLVRNTLAKAITATPGFEAYDRVDLKTIFGEQDFQRTGNVSNDQIKELGRMTGAQYIMVPEIAKMDAKTYYITAKILDVETAQAISMSDAITTADIANMQEACTQMAHELLSLPALKAQGKSIMSTNSKNKVSSNTNVGFSAETGEGHLAELGLQYKDGEFYQNGLTMSRSEVNALVIQKLKRDDQQAWEHYKKTSKRFIQCGWGLFGAGIAMSAIICPVLVHEANAIYSYYESGSGMKAIGFTMLGVGCGALVASLPCLVIGYQRKHRICNQYLFGANANNYARNMPNGAEQPYLTFNMQYNGNGLGVKLTF